MLVFAPRLVPVFLISFYDFWKHTDFFDGLSHTDLLTASLLNSQTIYTRKIYRTIRDSMKLSRKSSSNTFKEVDLKVMDEVTS